LKQKRIVSLIIVLVMLVFVVLYMTKTTNLGRQPSKHEIERHQSGNMPPHATYASTLPVNASEANVTSADIAQEQLQANNQQDFATSSENNTRALACISQWMQDALTANETLRCIEDYANKTNG
jgi:preprotein translocase subunit SecY